MAMPLVSSAATTYYLETGQSNANTTIDATHEMSWVAPGTTQLCLVTNCTTFVAADLAPLDFSWQLGGGIFTIKTNAATDDIFLNIWDVTSQAITGSPDTLSGNLVATAKADGVSNPCTSTASVQCVPSAYTPVDFFFDLPVTIMQGHEYIATLTSNTGTNGDNQYDIKGIDSLSIENSSSGGGAPLTDPNVVPEPTSFVLLAGGLLLASGLKYKSSRA